MASDDENVDYSSVELSSDDLSEEFSDDEHTHDADETQPALKRQKVAARHLDAIHGLGDGIDHEKEAEASILQLEIEELLSEVALPLDKATACHDCVQRVVAALKNLPEAEVKPEPIKGILMNFKFTPTVSDTCHLRRMHYYRDIQSARQLTSTALAIGPTAEALPFQDPYSSRCCRQLFYQLHA